MSTFISEPGTRLGGRYRLEDRVAAASGWAAWKAIDEILARAVTVLTFAPGFPRISEAITAARAASRLTDSRLAQVFDVEDDWDRAYVVMEWAAGDTLDDLLASGPLEPARGARIVAEAAAALSAAHAAGLAHLCLTPASLRMTQGGGVKVIGLGIDAALSGATAEDPALTDTTGLGRLLYAALTGHWPGPDYPALPPAPMADGNPRRPRQVRAGVPAALDDITCQALQLNGRTGPGLRRPGDLGSALKAVIPPLPPPPASPVLRPDAGRRGQPPEREHEHEYWPEGQRTRPGAARSFDDGSLARRRPSRARTVVIVALTLVVMAGIVAATTPLWHRHPSGAASAARSHAAHKQTAAVTVLTPVAASGYDPLTSPANDPYNENSQLAKYAIDGNPGSAWDSQEYDSASFGNLKTGSGLILDLGRQARLSSITVVFGSSPGANVQIKVGSSEARSAAALNSLTTVAQATNVSGSYTFTTTSAATGRYVLIWFTSLPPDPGASGKYMAQVSDVIVHGSSG
jgi:serine/threonine protein kinase